MSKRTTGEPTSLKVQNLRRKHPSWSLVKIGKQVGVSRQRVHQILRRASMRTPSGIKQNLKTTGVSTKDNLQSLSVESVDNSHKKASQQIYSPRFTRILSSIMK